MKITKTKLITVAILDRGGQLSTSAETDGKLTGEACYSGSIACKTERLEDCERVKSQLSVAHLGRQLVEEDKQGAFKDRWTRVVKAGRKAGGGGAEANAPSEVSREAERCADWRNERSEWSKMKIGSSGGMSLHATLPTTRWAPLMSSGGLAQARWDAGREAISRDINDGSGKGSLNGFSFLRSLASLYNYTWLAPREHPVKPCERTCFSHALQNRSRQTRVVAVERTVSESPSGPSRQRSGSERAREGLVHKSSAREIADGGR
ncbi:hypothetical protein C8R44DRAFT_743017 [Mycena epipterygia]|nr:hypothetical protein C8R44DRAFT_743017 [Mycena epipterygia]